MTANTAGAATPKRNLDWRVVDIVVASVLGVACGFVFLGWNAVGYAWYEANGCSYAGSWRLGHRHLAAWRHPGRIGHPQAGCSGVRGGSRRYRVCRLGFAVGH